MFYIPGSQVPPKPLKTIPGIEQLSQLGANWTPIPQGHLAMSGDIFDHHTARVVFDWHPAGRTHRTAPSQ